MLIKETKVVSLGSERRRGLHRVACTRCGRETVTTAGPGMPVSCSSCRKKRERAAEVATREHRDLTWAGGRELQVLGALKAGGFKDAKR